MDLELVTRKFQEIGARLLVEEVVDTPLSRRFLAPGEAGIKVHQNNGNRLRLLISNEVIYFFGA